MRHDAHRLLLLTCISVALGLPAYAKGPLEKIVISGSKLAHPLEATDPELLHLSDPWLGRFADWSSPPQAAPAGPVYDLTLYAKVDELKAIYRLRYAPGSHRGA